ncbi:MAG: hypothetical protein GXO27_03860 [Chlorobi bacterium]|nr:hypothetical protein [Chlorobiota bacterium]
MKRLIVLLGLAMGIGSAGCRKAFDVAPSYGDFRTDRDTLFLDSVFIRISSPTYYFKIYNTSDKAIVLDEVAPARGEESYFRLNVDGDAGKIFKNVSIPPRDSIYVFVEFTADVSALPDPVYEEPLLIRDRAVTDTVLLTAFVKDAYFLYPALYADRSVDSIQIGTYGDGTPVRVPGFLISRDTVLTADKPVVIYGHLGVPPGKTLTIEAGAHIYFHYNSGIVVFEDATLRIEGTLDRPVILEDDRMQPEYETAPGMWNFIWLKEGSKNNLIRYAVIKNAVAGIIAHPPGPGGEPVLEVANTRIFNMSAFGLIALGSKVTGYNVVTNNCGLSSVALLLGGNYDFKHCTFANYSSAVRRLPFAAVWISNGYETYDTEGNPVTYTRDLENCRIANSIIYGNQEVELFVHGYPDADMHFLVHNNLIRFEDPAGRIHSPYMDFDNPLYYRDNVLNGRPDFEDPAANKMRIGLESDAIGIGDPAVTATVPLDITGTDRTDSPDAGAYKHAPLDD